MLVGVGVSQNGYIGDVEIIDLRNSSNFCFNLTKLPNLLEKTAALVAAGNPLICGELRSLYTLDKSLQVSTTVKLGYNELGYNEQMFWFQTTSLLHKSIRL